MQNRTSGARVRQPISSNVSCAGAERHNVIYVSGLDAVRKGLLLLNSKAYLPLTGSQG
jgi:hypothetical protein